MSRPELERAGAGRSCTLLPPIHLHRIRWQRLKAADTNSWLKGSVAPSAGRSAAARARRASRRWAPPAWRTLSSIRCRPRTQSRSRCSGSTWRTARPATRCTPAPGSPRRATCTRSSTGTTWARQARSTLIRYGRPCVYLPVRMRRERQRTVTARVRACQAHRGFTMATDEAGFGPLSSCTPLVLRSPFVLKQRPIAGNCNPLFWKPAPTNGKFSAQRCYGYISVRG